MKRRIVEAHGFDPSKLVEIGGNVGRDSGYRVFSNVGLLYCTGTVSMLQIGCFTWCILLSKCMKAGICTYMQSKGQSEKSFDNFVIKRGLLAASLLILVTFLIEIHFDLISMNFAFKILQLLTLLNMYQGLKPPARHMRDITNTIFHGFYLAPQAGDFPV